jgi:hypothetical protein
METKERYKLLALLLLALGGWFASSPSYSALLAPQSISGLFAIVGGVLGSAFGVTSNGNGNSNTKP